jgi:hypothetical protein
VVLKMLRNIMADASTNALSSVNQHDALTNSTTWHMAVLHAGITQPVGLSRVHEFTTTLAAIRISRGIFCTTMDAEHSIGLRLEVTIEAGLFRFLTATSSVKEHKCKNQNYNDSDCQDSLGLRALSS